MRFQTCFASAMALLPALLPAQGAPPADRTAYAHARTTTQPHGTASIAFTIPQRDLFAENVAHDPRDGSFYVGSTRHGNVTRRTRDGRVSEFIPGGRDGMWMVVGMKVDTRRNALWVNSSGASNYVRHAPSDAGRAALFRFDLRTGRLTKRYATADTGRHFFNDLVIAGDGSIFVTDMLGGAIYRVDPRADSLVRWTDPGAMQFPNGVDLSGDGRTLFVAAREGIHGIDVASRERRLLAVADTTIDVLGIDGLYWHRGALLGVQGGRRNRVQRFELDAAGNTIVRATTLEAHHPMFMNPTTGVLAGDSLFVVANSQFASFTSEGVPFPPERLYETVILRVPLPGAGGTTRP